MAYSKYIQNILGVDVRARYSEEDSENTYEPFKNPIKQINGQEIVTLNLTKLWGNRSS